MVSPLSTENGGGGHGDVGINGDGVSTLVTVDGAGGDGTADSNGVVAAHQEFWC